MVRTVKIQGLDIETIDTEASALIEALVTAMPIADCCVTPIVVL